MTPLEAAWQAVLDAPDDDQALHVLGDALMEQGDPHGELIRLQLAGDEEGAAEHLARHPSELVGDPVHLTSWSPRFARGFLSSVTIGSAEHLEAVIGRPVGRLLRQVDVSALTSEPIERIVEVLAARGPRTLARLRFLWDGVNAGYPGELQVAPLAARLTSLETLELGPWALSFEGTVSASLRHLRVNMLNSVRGFEEARFPSLEKLSLELPFRGPELPPALLSGEITPRLSSLRLSQSLFPQQLAALAGSALLRGLSELEIFSVTETGWYTTLLKAIDAFAHLRRIELLADPHHPEWVAAVKAALPRAIVR